MEMNRLGEEGSRQRREGGVIRSGDRRDVRAVERQTAVIADRGRHRCEGRPSRHGSHRVVCKNDSGLVEDTRRGRRGGRVAEE